jgi:dolichol-phosphate mannosyltransferase
MIQKNKKTVSVIIPTKNEEGYIKQTIKGVSPYADEILVIDGHSTDKTVEYAESMGARVIFDNGKGKGAALRLAAQDAKGDIVVFIDADGSHDPEDIPELLKPILEGKADLVMGSRMRGGSDELHSSLSEFIRLMGSAIITLAINYRFKQQLTDYQNGFRAIKREVMNRIETTENIFTIEQEMSIKCLKNRYKVTEVPTHEYRRVYGKSKIKVWKVAWRYVWCLVKNII